MMINLFHESYKIIELFDGSQRDQMTLFLHTVFAGIGPRNTVFRPDKLQTLGAHVNEISKTRVAAVVTVPLVLSSTVIEWSGMVRDDL